MITLQEVLQKELLGVSDIQVIFNCGKSRAYKVIREIKTVSDAFHLKGKIHRRDYENYLTLNATIKN